MGEYAMRWTMVLLTAMFLWTSTTFGQIPAGKKWEWLDPEHPDPKAAGSGMVSGNVEAPQVPPSSAGAAEPPPIVLPGPRNLPGPIPQPLLPSLPAPVLPPAPLAVASLPLDKGKLRQLAYMPNCDLRINFGDVGGLVLDSKTRKRQDPAERIAELEKELKGDASDAERDLELAGLYEQQKRSREVCDAAYARAREHFKERVQAEPTSGWLHAQYADALMPQVAAAAAQALEAVRCAAADYRCWQQLAAVRYAQIPVTLFGSEDLVPWNQVGNVSKLFELCMASKPAPEQVEKAEQYLQETLKCADKAVALAPEQIAVYQQRYVFQALSYFYWQRGLRLLRNQPPLAEDQAFLRTHLVDDARQMARLCPDDPEFVGNLAFICFFEAAITSRQQSRHSPQASPLDEQKAAWATLPEAARKATEEAMLQLERLSKSLKPVQAAAACRRLGVLLLLKGELSRAAELGQRATVLDPSCQENWDLLLGCKSLNGEASDAQATYEVCEKQLRHLDTARNRLVLAITCVELHRIDEAEKHLRAALKQWPDDVRCRLGLAAVLLLQGEQPATVAEVGRCLEQAAEPARTSGSDDLWYAFRLNLAIFLALTDQPALSRQLFQAISVSDPTAQRPKKALELFAEAEEKDER
jgi:tetratricopeptide (TPR) repeat protein